MITDHINQHVTMLSVLSHICLLLYMVLLVCYWYSELCMFRLLLPIQNFVEEMGPGIFALCDDKGHTPAHWACLGGHTDILRFIIDNKVRISLCHQL